MLGIRGFDIDLGVGMGPRAMLLIAADWERQELVGNF